MRRAWMDDADARARVSRRRSRAVMTVTRRREGAVATRASAEEVFVDVGEAEATEEEGGVMSNAGDEDEMFHSSCSARARWPRRRFIPRCLRCISTGDYRRIS